MWRWLETYGRPSWGTSWKGHSPCLLLDMVLDTTIARIWSEPFTYILIFLPPPRIDMTTFFKETHVNDSINFSGEFIIPHHVHRVPPLEIEYLKDWVLEKINYLGKHSKRWEPWT